MSSLIKKNEFIGVGCLLQLLGLLSPIVLGFIAGSIGVIFGIGLMIALFVIGSNKSRRFYCGDCNNPLDNKNVKVCPSCKAEFQRKSV